MFFHEEEKKEREQKRKGKETKTKTKKKRSGGIGKRGKKIRIKMRIPLTWEVVEEMEKREGTVGLGASFFSTALFLEGQNSGRKI